MRECFGCVRVSVCFCSGPARGWGYFGLKHQSVCHPFACFTLCCILSGAKRFCVFGIGHSLYVCVCAIVRVMRKGVKIKKTSGTKTKWTTLGKMHKICAYIIWLGVRPARCMVWYGVCIGVLLPHCHCCCCLWLHYFHKYACGMRQFLLLIKMQRSNTKTPTQTTKNKKGNQKIGGHHSAGVHIFQVCLRIDWIPWAGHQFLLRIFVFCHSPLHTHFQLHWVQGAWHLGQLISVTSTMDFHSNFEQRLGGRNFC